MNKTTGSSDRSFGIVFCVVFLVIGLYPLLSGQFPRMWALGTSVAFFVIALAKPTILSPLNKLWTEFGLLIHKVINPVVMAVVYFVVVTPIGLLMRVFSKDPLRLRFEPLAKSYWIDRTPPGPPPESFTNQF